MQIAADRGYLTERAVYWEIGKRFEMTPKQVERMFSDGRFTWERLLVLGVMFEMEPREFCDAFLSNYFRENDQGHFIATIDNEYLMLHPIPKTVMTKKQWEKEFEDEE